MQDSFCQKCGEVFNDTLKPSASRAGDFIFFDQGHVKFSSRDFSSQYLIGHGSIAVVVDAPDGVNLSSFSGDVCYGCLSGMLSHIQIEILSNTAFDPSGDIPHDEVIFQAFISGAKSHRLLAEKMSLVAIHRNSVFDLRLGPSGLRDQINLIEEMKFTMFGCRLSDPEMRIGVLAINAGSNHAIAMGSLNFSQDVYPDEDAATLWLEHLADHRIGARSSSSTKDINLDLMPVSATKH